MKRISFNLKTHKSITSKSYPIVRYEFRENGKQTRRLLNNLINSRQKMTI